MALAREQLEIARNMLAEMGRRLLTLHSESAMCECDHEVCFVLLYLHLFRLSVHF